MGEPTSGKGTIPLSGCKPVFGQKHTERPLRKAKTDASVRQKGLFENSETTRPRRPPLSFPFEDNTPEGLRALLAANRHYREVAWPVRMGLRPTNRDENPCKCFGGRALAGAGLKPRLQQHRQRGWVFDCAPYARTIHRLHCGDARDLSWIPDASVHLVVTSPPYWTLKEYTPGNADQMGHFEDYDHFLLELDRVWRECRRVLVGGGRICCVVGDVCIT